MLQGKGLGRLDDIDQLTMFADYRVPVTLRELGILRYSNELEQKVALSCKKTSFLVLKICEGSPLATRGIFGAMSVVLSDYRLCGDKQRLRASL